MRFGSNIAHLAIPEWKQCYLDYEHLKIFIRLIKAVVETIHVCENILKENQNASGDDSELLQESIDNSLQQYVTELKQLGEQANKLFFDAHIKSMGINRLFMHMKLLEMGFYFQQCQAMLHMNLQGEELQLLMSIVEYTYIETQLLESAKQMNLEGERKILKKHLKYAEGYFETPRRRNKKVIRISQSLTKLITKIQQFYVENKPGSSKVNRDNLRILAKTIQSSNADAFIFGSWIGICFTIMGVLIAILSYTGKSIETDPVFNRDFPTWRGIASFIIYIWILGINVYGYEKYSISHKIIFEFNEHHYSRATTIFKVSGFFSTFFLVMFAIYTLQIANIINLGPFPDYYLVLFVWGLFLLYLINPFPVFSFRSRLYALKLTIKSILAPLIGVSFPVIWMTDQLISLITPFKDLAYTICYYQYLRKDSIESSYKICNSNTKVQIVLMVGAFAYSFRMLQCMKQGYDKGTYLGTHQFFNTIKYAFSLTTLTLSYFWKAGNDTIFYAWIVFASLSTVYSYTWDVKIDWALFEKDSPHKFLRKNLCYPVNSYYVILIINALFRIVWVFTLSPSIANNAFGSPQIFSLVTGTIQIIRRGIWNMLRVERQHLANCHNFKATPNMMSTIKGLILEKSRQRRNSAQMNASSQMIRVAETLNSIQIENENIQKECKFVKSKHLQILYGLLDAEVLRKAQRTAAQKKLKKKIQYYTNILKPKAQKNKKNRVAPQNQS